MIKKVLKFFSQHENEFRITRKAKTFIPKKYEALPPWQTPEEKDPHDYKLRNKEEIKKWLEIEKKKENFEYDIVINIYPNNMEPHHHYGDKVKIIFYPNKLGLSSLQQRRLIDLAGVRYDKKKNFIHITSKHFDNLDDNLNKAIHIGQELYLEAIRAPLDEIEDDSE